MTEYDEGRGLVKTCWADIRQRVLPVEPRFTQIVDNLNPDKTFPIYLAYLPYGSLKGDTTSTFLPDNKNSFFRLNDPNAPKDIIKHLGYGMHSSPLGMVLDKELEYFIDMRQERTTIPWAIYRPGTFFSFARNLNEANARTYAPNGVLTAASGARSVLMLPNIGCASNHINLQRDFNIRHSAPKSHYEHWMVFKDIIHSEALSCDWRSCLVYFSEKWVHHLHHDPAWLQLKMYLHEKAWGYFEHQRCRIYYDIAFSMIQKNRNLRPNPYLTDTARHLFTIALGDAPGYAPSCNNNSLPLDLIQKAYLQSYGLKKYYPTIMQPVKFHFETDKAPVYYSLQHPSTYMFSPKSRTTSNTVYEMRELQHIMRIFMSELADDKSMCSDTVINLKKHGIHFNYYHSKTDSHRVIQHSKMIAEADKRFTPSFACDAPFVRGCISIQAAC